MSTSSPLYGQQEITRHRGECDGRLHSSTVSAEVAGRQRRMDSTKSTRAVDAIRRSLGESVSVNSYSSVRYFGRCGPVAQVSSTAPLAAA